MAHAATVQVGEIAHSPFPRSASVYALKELARRGGVAAELFGLWKIEFDRDNFLSVYVKPGARSRIRFPLASQQFWQEINAGSIRTSTASWMHPPTAAQENISDVKIPFSTREARHIGPLFALQGRDCIECAVDLPISALLTLSRFEETRSFTFDDHNRFSAFSSIAWRDGFLHRPVVDECALAFAQAVACLLPTWKPDKNHFRVLLGHDVDDVGLPFVFRSALGHALRRRSTASTFRDLLAPVLRSDTTYQHLLRKLVMISVARGLKPAIYWKSSSPGPYDRGYRLQDKRISALAKEFTNRGIEMGIHPGYQTFRSREKLSAELNAVQRWLGQRPLGGRQDYLRWNPGTWLLWESLGMAYDASVGFADHIGFRAGTCHPYRPWLISEQREANLLEVPLLAMDTTLQGYMKLNPEEALSRLQACVAKCRAVGGVFSLAWHNTTMMNAGYTRIYTRLVEELAGSESYDWRAPSNAID
jgi:hypothetical protein